MVTSANIDFIFWRNEDNPQRSHLARMESRTFDITKPAQIGELVALCGQRNPYGKLGVIEEGAIACRSFANDRSERSAQNSTNSLAFARADSEFVQR